MNARTTGFRASVCCVLLMSWSPSQADAKPVREYLQTRTDQTEFSGGVLVKVGSSIVLREAYGFAERELSIRLTPDSIFRIGSLTKPFTATGILLLAERNQLSLNDSVCSFIDGCPKTWQSISIRNLLNHTSGIPDLFGHLDAVPVEDTVAEVTKLLRSLDSPELQSDPGEEYSYSNFNYVLLGCAIERYSDQRWEDFLISEMFGPLEMDNTLYDDVWALVSGRARGYTVSDNRVANIEYDDHAAYAAGGLRSTLDDLGNWHSAYIEDRIVSAKIRKLATSPGLGDYGLGWQALKMFGRSMYNHTGGIDGFASHLAYYPGEELLVIVLSNSDHEDTKATACDIAALILDSEPLPTGDAGWLETPRRERCREFEAE